MKITKGQLRRIIREELRHVLAEQSQPDKTAEVGNTDYLARRNATPTGKASQISVGDWVELLVGAAKLNDAQKKGALSYDIAVTLLDDADSDTDLVVKNVPKSASAAKMTIKDQRK